MTITKRTVNRLAFGLSVLAVAGATLATVMMTGCNETMPASAEAAPRSATPAESSDLIRVETVLVERQDLTKTVEMPGTVEGYETADLYARASGFLAEMHVDIGDVIQKGQELARLDIPEMEKELAQKLALVAQAKADAQQAAAAIHQAEADLASQQAVLYEVETAEKAQKEAELRLRQADLQRYQNLVNASAARSELLDQARFQHEAALAALQSVEAKIRTARSKVNAAEASLAKAKADHQSALARIDVAQANVDHTETMMRYATIRAPFDGYVVKRWVDRGALIQAADRPLLTVTRSDKVRVWLDVPMSKVAMLQRGDRAVLDRINVLPGETFEGVVSRFSPSLNKNSRLMRVEIDLPNPEGRLRPGYYGYLTVFLEEQSETPIVPSSALLSDGKGQFVYVVKNDTAHKQPVVTSYNDGVLVGIASGLSGGEQVVRAGGGQIHDGQRCTPVLAVN